MIFGAAALILGICVAVVPFYIFPVCEAGMMPMRCFWTARAELILGILTGLLGVVSLLRGFGRRQSAVG